MLQKTRNIVAFLGLLMVSFSLFGQQTKDTSKNAAPIKHKVLLIPFKPTMLMSEIGKAVNNSTHLSYNKITEAFRYRMDHALYNTFKLNYSTVSLLQEVKKGDTTLPYIYASIGYKYDLIPGKDSSGESHAEFDPKQQKSHFINNGQLQVPIDYSKRFMNVSLSNPSLLSYLSKKSGADIFIFVNELDIKNVANNETEDLTASNFRRQVTIQYSIVNSIKQYISKGILTTYFPSSENDPKVIGEKYFSVIAQEMLLEFKKNLAKIEAIKATPGAIHHTKTVTNKK